ncbi:PAS domain S-box protein [Sphingomicrobium astaxanthinifaciens]|uniref:PAS domain S-box protein n=1 Tax=Sphingomicrobium astaxanthinifaciens TaxID=1227949 RepID=UPI001FCC611E|nr:PAS domain S-box protein [Sphingomicrobium astaxanthinifaciens]MCJ7420530.1 PAS domain S-box protein [Sphingomicrobium astaxanthinifaciens]
MKRVSHYIDPAILEGILATALDAVIVSDADGKIVEWNQQATTTLGWKREDIIGKTLKRTIVPECHRESHAAGMARLKNGAPARILNRRLELMARHRSGEEIPVEMAITEIGKNPNNLFIGFLRDITERKKYEDALTRRAVEAESIATMSGEVANARDFESALTRSLDAILQLTEWPVGHAFIRPNPDPVLVSSGVWVERDADCARLKAATKDAVFPIGVGMPGKILATGEPMWIENIERYPEFIRQDHEFGSAFGFPLKSEGIVIAVLEFFANSATRPPEELLKTVKVLGEQLGVVIERKRQEDRQKTLVNELNHRVKNTISIVQGIAHQTFVDGAPMDQAREIFMRRLNAVASAHQLLMSENWKHASITDIVAHAIEGCGGALDRIRITGRDFDVRPEIAVSIALAIHELCTNAYKYGALSVPEGHVEIRWTLAPEADAPTFLFRWAEFDGPPVSPPTKRGFGSRLLERGLSKSLGGKVDLIFDPAGFRARFTSPLSRKDNETE